MSVIRPLILIAILLTFFSGAASALDKCQLQLDVLACLAIRDCSFCASTLLCMATSNISSANCIGYVDRCSSFNRQAEQCAMVFYNNGTATPNTQWAQKCEGDQSFCSKCQFCASTQQCVTPANFTATCGKPFGTWCEQFNADTTACNCTRPLRLLHLHTEMPRCNNYIPHHLLWLLQRVFRLGR